MKNIEKYKDDVLDNVDACSIDAWLRRMNVSPYCKGYNCEGCKERFLKWLLEECKEPVLDDAERKYLSDVIRPFRGIVTGIKKEQFYGNGTEEYISIEIHHESGFRERINMPNFDRNTMYKGMEINKKYTLKELGL